MPSKDLRVTLDLWMWESPTTLIPSNEQITEVISVIQCRHDVDQCTDILSDCIRYIEGDISN